MGATLEEQARDPHTPLTQLQYLAQHYPQLRPAIAQNPSTYPALLTWLGNLHDPAIDAALSQRHCSEKTSQHIPEQPRRERKNTFPSRKERNRVEKQDAQGDESSTIATASPHQLAENSRRTGGVYTSEIPTTATAMTPTTQTVGSENDVLNAHSQGVQDQSEAYDSDADFIHALLADDDISDRDSSGENDSAQGDGEHEDSESDDAPTKKQRSRLAVWITAIVIVLALVGATLVAGILTDTIPLADYLVGHKGLKHTSADAQGTRGGSGAGNQEGKKIKVVEGEPAPDLSAPHDENANGIPDDQENLDKGGLISLSQQDRLVVPPPENPDVRRPVPDGSITNIEKFANFDESIQCAIGAGGVQCVLNRPASSLDIGNEGKPIRITMDQSLDVDVEKLDAQAAKTGQIRLAKDAAVTQGDFVCQGKDSNGIECWQTHTGHGFVISPSQVGRF